MTTTLPSSVPTPARARSVHAAGSRVVAARTEAALAEHRAAWQRLAGSCSQPGALAASYAWVQAYLAHREPLQPACVLFAYDADRLVGVLPLVVRPHRLFGMRRPWLHVPSDVHTTAGGMLLHTDATPEHVDELLEAAFREHPQAVGLRVGGLWPDDLLTRSLQERPRTLVQEERLAGRSVDTSRPWSSYHAALGRNLRRNLRKARNRLEKSGSLLLASSSDAAELDRFLTLERAGWKGRAAGAVACDDALTSFYRAMSKTLEAEARIRWHRLELDGNTLAMALEIRMGTQAILQRVAFDERAQRQSPGQVLHAALLEQWFEDPTLDRVDCLTDQPWHETWKMERTPYQNAFVFAPGLLPTLSTAWPTRLWQRLRRSKTLRALHRRLGRGGAE